MKTIKFGTSTNIYPLVDDINVDSSRIQATVIKGEFTVDQIATEAKAAEAIFIYEDGTKVAEYDGYTTPVAFTLHDDNVSVEMMNTDVLGKLATLQTAVDTYTEEIDSLDAGVTDLANEITAIDENIADLNESQLSQDAAIEDLAETMAEME